MAAGNPDISATEDSTPHLEVRNLTMAYGSFVVMKNINFTVRHREIFIIMGGSGCGKSTLLRHLIGLQEPATGDILYNGVSFTKSGPLERQRMLRRFGVLYQSGALWSSMTLAENVGLPLGEFTDLNSGGDSGGSLAEARDGWAQGLRGLLSEPDKRRNAEAGRIGARDRT